MTHALRNIGVNVTKPTTPIDTFGAITVRTNSTAVLNNDVQVRFLAAADGTAAGDTATIGSMRAIVTQASPVKSKLELRTNSGDNSNPAMELNSAAEVGIPTVTDGNGKLQVTTSDRIGVLITKSSDNNNAQEINNSGLGSGLALNMTSTGATSGALVIAKSSTASSGNLITTNQSGSSTSLRLNLTNTANSASFMEMSGNGTGRYIATNAGGTLGGTGAQLTNGGTWTNATCFKDTKLAIEEIDEATTEDFVNKVEAMPIARYISKFDNSENPRRILGPFQDELVNWFGLGAEGVNPGEIATIALVAIKGLTKKIKELETEINLLKNQTD